MIHQSASDKIADTMMIPSRIHFRPTALDSVAEDAELQYPDNSTTFFHPKKKTLASLSFHDALMTMNSSFPLQEEEEGSNIILSSPTLLLKRKRKISASQLNAGKTTR